MFYRCHFEYSPNEDKQFPKGEAGLSFQAGDIVEIIDQSDTDWWQVVFFFYWLKTSFNPESNLTARQLE